jgi:hypothetical protein
MSINFFDSANQYDSKKKNLDFVTMSLLHTNRLILMRKMAKNGLQLLKMITNTKSFLLH